MLGDDLAKQAVAIIRKTVVGKIGRIAPKTAKPTQKTPVIFHKKTFILLRVETGTGHSFITKDSIAIVGFIADCWF